MTAQAPPLARVDLDALARLDTCTVSDAIERLDFRPRNEGFVHGAVRCVFPDLPPMLGYAVTGRIRTSTQPVAGRCYHDRIDWWRHILSVPAPRVLVLQDVGTILGLGAFVDEVHANIAAALECVGCVTNGAVRDVDAVHARGFHLFAGNLSPSHAYAHIVDYGAAVDIGELKVHPGDLVHGDQHGVRTVPLSVAVEVPGMAKKIKARERKLIDLCQSKAFSLDALEKMLGRVCERTALTPTPTPPPR